MRMVVVVTTQPGQRALRIVNVTSHMKIAVHSDCAVILQLDETAGAMDQPKFAYWCGRWVLSAGKRSSDDDAVLGITLLRKNQDLIAR